MLIVRSLNESDYTAFWQIRLEAFQRAPFAFGSSYEVTSAWSEETKLSFFQRNVTPSNNYIFGAFLDNKLVGIAGLRRETEIKVQHRADIWGVYVQAEARGQGAGKALMQALIAQARTLPGLLQLHLHVSVSQEAARQLYLNCGFESYGREWRALKIGNEFVDSDMMWLRLDD